MSCLIAWDGTSKIMLNVNGDSGNEFYGNFIREKKGDCREKVLQLLKIC